MEEENKEYGLMQVSTPESGFHPPRLCTSLIGSVCNMNDNNIRFITTVLEGE